MLTQLATLLFLFAPTAGSEPSHPLHLSGMVRFADESAARPVEGLRLFVKADGQVLARTTVKNTGRYELVFTPEQRRSFAFYYTGAGMDTTHIRTFTRFESDVMQWDIVL